MSEPVTINGQVDRIDAVVPAISDITMKDVSEALAAGLRDFQDAPQYGLLFGALYAFGGFFLVLTTIWSDSMHLIYPLAAGFALIGPFVAVGLYEVSRRREQGLPLSWGAILQVMTGQRGRQMGWMAFVTMFIFVVWMYAVKALQVLFFGAQSFTSLHEFVTMLLTTPTGIMFLMVGNVVGAILAFGVFALTVVSFPMLLDRDTNFITAMMTSVQAVIRNPSAMIGWAFIVAIDLAFSAIPMFLGLIITLPVIGHATWHLYRRLVGRNIPQAHPI